MCGLLLSNTDIVIKFEDSELEPMKTNVGSPQGDAISGTSFNVALEASLRDLRAIIYAEDPSIDHCYAKKTFQPPEELIYADDTDFVTENKENIRRSMI
eukprot:Seg2981.1 transcript_id=Seg2981.1/GoldUCD/mRNA.D3Y31 product="hypothetical protein" pseudo=true protein_id=Seg2981.1/GoldUCD/D3Y31